MQTIELCSRESNIKDHLIQTRKTSLKTSDGLGSLLGSVLPQADPFDGHARAANRRQGATAGVVAPGLWLHDLATSNFLLLVRHLFLVAMHLFLVASCYQKSCQTNCPPFWPPLKGSFCPSIKHLLVSGNLDPFTGIVHDSKNPGRLRNHHQELV